MSTTAATERQVDSRRQLPRVDLPPWCEKALVAVLLILAARPAVRSSTAAAPIHAELHPGAGLRRDGARPEHRGRLRRPAGPRLRRVLRHRRLHRRLVRLGLLLQRRRRRGHPRPRQRPAAKLPGHALQLPAGPGDRGDPVGGRRDADRPADAAPARRLHRDRDARVRRDHRPHRHQRRRHQDRRPAAHGRPPGHHAGGPDRPAGRRARSGCWS